MNKKMLLQLWIEAHCASCPCTNIPEYEGFCGTGCFPESCWQDLSKNLREILVEALEECDQERARQHSLR